MVGVADSKIADLKIMKMWPNSESILPLFSKKGLYFICPSLFTDPKCHLGCHGNDVIFPHWLPGNKSTCQGVKTITFNLCHLVPRNGIVCYCHLFIYETGQHKYFVNVFTSFGLLTLNISRRE